MTYALYGLHSNEQLIGLSCSSALPYARGLPCGRLSCGSISLIRTAHGLLRPVEKSLGFPSGPLGDATRPHQQVDGWADGRSTVGRVSPGNLELCHCLPRAAGGESQ